VHTGEAVVHAAMLYLLYAFVVRQGGVACAEMQMSVGTGLSCGCRIDTL